MRLEWLLLGAAGGSEVIDDRGLHDADTLRRRAAGVARRLRRGGVEPNGRVALVAENGADLLAGLFGILASGATAVPLDPGMPPGGLPDVLRTVGASHLCVAGRRALGLAETALAGLSRPVVLALEDLGEAPTDGLAAGATGLSDRDPAFVFFSSGTTGRPKGIVLSHRAVFENMLAIEDYLAPRPTDRFYVAKSMVHSSTVTGEILLAFRSGAALIARNPVVPPKLLFRRIEAHRPTLICIPPSLLTFFDDPGLDRRRLESLHTIHVSGARVHQDTFRRVCQRYPSIRLINAYGLTEAGPRVCQSGTTTGFKPGSVGKPIRGVSVQVRSPDGQCAAGEVGELWVRSKGLMDGYLEGDRLSRRALAGGWLRTADLGYADEDGDLFIVGRRDDLIVTGSHNVNPRDVEEVIERVPGVGDCVVFGVRDDLLGERVVCAYRRDPSADRAALMGAMRRASATELAAFQRPKSFYEWDEIPRNRAGKRLRRVAQARLSGT